MESGRPRVVFCYAYRPGPLSGAQDGGFCVHLRDDDSLTFTCYSFSMQPVSELVFPLQRGCHRQVIALMDGAKLWLREFPHYMRVNEQPETIAHLGFDGYSQMFRIDDFMQLMSCPFRTKRGHYARMMYNLLEDISTILLTQGIDLKPDGFTWMEGVQPLQSYAQQTGSQLMYG